jgi:DNA-binding transcriptional LysR family regulator
MDDFRLKVFKEVAEKKSFSKAASSIYISQPAVSGQIRNLEEQLGARLFERTSEGVILTEPGQVLLKYAERILSDYKEAKKEIASLISKPEERLVIGASTTLGEYLLPRMIPDFKKLHPKVTFFLKIGNVETTLFRLKEEELNLALLEINYKKNGWMTKEFFVDELVLIVPKGHHLASEKTIDLTTLRKEPFILRENGSGTRRILAEKLCKLDMELACLNIVLEADSTESVKSTVAAGLGISLISRLALKNDERFVTLLIKNLDLTHPFYLIYPEKQTPVLKSFLTFLDNYSNP